MKANAGEADPGCYKPSTKEWNNFTMTRPKPYTGWIVRIKLDCLYKPFIEARNAEMTLILEGNQDFEDGDGDEES